MLHQSGLFKYQPSEHVTSIQEATQAIQRRGINPKLYKKLNTMMVIILY